MKTLLLLVSTFGVALAIRNDLFSSTTAYRWIQPIDVNSVAFDDLYNITDDQGGLCRAVQFTAVFRQGSRSPSSSDISKMSSLHTNTIRNRMGNDRRDIINWSNRFDPRRSYELTVVGAREQEGLGMRFAKRLRTLFANAQSATEFVASDKQYAIDSAKNFHIGVEQILSNGTHNPMAPVTDTDRTRFYHFCQKWIDSVHHNDTVKIEERGFLHGIEMFNVSKYVNEELFGSNHHHLSSSSVRLLLKYCGYELDMFGSSVWCPLFRDWDQEVIEYYHDLYNYYIYGPDNEINYGQTCPLMSDIFLNMDKFVNNNNHHNRFINKFLFGHEETLLTLSAAFGLFDDSIPPRADNFEMMKNRTYVTSKIAPFAGNIGLVLYQCDNPVSITNVNQYRSNFAIKIFSNEYEDEIPGCKSKLCPYSFVREKYSDLVDHCNFDVRCRVDNDPGVIG